MRSGSRAWILYFASLMNFCKITQKICVKMLDLAPLLLYNFKDASCSVVSSELKGLLLWLSW